jgi:trehalose utilization protein
MSKLKVTVWSEGLPDWQPEAQKCYPDDINTAVAAFLKEDAELEVTTSHLTHAECGLSQEIVDNTDVLVFWAHCYHDDVTDEAVERVVSAVLQRGMGLVLLHSGYFSKIGNILLGRGRSGGKYRECGERARVWVVNRAHPIVEGLEEDWFDIEYDEMYGEPFGIPTPDDLIFINWFQGGEVLRSGAVWNRGAGRVFYFQPGHEEKRTKSHN